MLLIVIALNLVALVALAFIVPHLMVSPGALVKEHAELTTDCFACHAPWRGAASNLCIECHAVASIGLRTTKGAPIAKDTIKASFHQDLVEQNCMACHSDHQGPRLAQRSRKLFSHALLHEATRERCASCHAAPKDAVHRDLTVGCRECHKTESWKPAQFDHKLLAGDVLDRCASCHAAPKDAPHRDVTANCVQCHKTAAWKPVEVDHKLLAKAVLDRCESCHKAPSDRLHRQIQGNCSSCHKTEAWKPATFDHDKFFVLDRDHNVRCDTCHTGNDYGRYSCYGCHEHRPDKVRAAVAFHAVLEFARRAAQTRLSQPRRAQGG